MKVNCEIIQDLLPLYEEGLCSPGSKEAVEKHLAECESCKLLKESTDRFMEIKLSADPSEIDFKAAKKLKRMRRKWFASLAAVLAVTCILGLLLVSSLRVTCSRETEVWALPPYVTVDNVTVYYAENGDQFRIRGTYQDCQGSQWYIVSGISKISPASSGLDCGFILKDACVIGFNQTWINGT